LASDDSFFGYYPALVHHPLRALLEFTGVFPQQLRRGSFDFLFELVDLSLKVLDNVFSWHLEDELELLAYRFMVFDVSMQKGALATHAVSERLVDVPAIFPSSLGRLTN
jgi:hypothetical protein